MWDSDKSLLAAATLVILHGSACAFAKFVLKRDLQKEPGIKVTGGLIILGCIWMVAAAAMDLTPSAGPSYRNWSTGLTVVVLILGGYLWVVRSFSPTAFACGEIALGIASAVAVSSDSRPDEFGITVTYMVAIFLLAQGLHDLNVNTRGRLTSWMKKRPRPPAPADGSSISQPEQHAP